MVRSYNDLRFRYIVPPKVDGFGMCYNWEYGLSFAQGEYVIFIQDKMYMYDDTLQRLDDYLTVHPDTDVISWSWDFYSIRDEQQGFAGTLGQRRTTGVFTEIDRVAAVREKLAFARYNYQNEQGAPGVASPLCSAIRRDIYDRMRSRYGMVFDFINPDYGPPIRVLDLARRVVESEDNLAVLIPLNKSEGKTHNTYELALRFLTTSPAGLKRLEYAPVPGLRVTNSNMVAADYNYSVATSDCFTEVGACDVANVVITIARQLKPPAPPPPPKKNIIRRCYALLPLNWRYRIGRLLKRRGGARTFDSPKQAISRFY